MKKARTIILIALFIAGIAISSCNRKLCPAYTKADTEQTTKQS